MKRKYDELKSIHKEMGDRVNEIRNSMEKLLGTVKELREELGSLEIAEDALGKTIDIINSKALNLGNGAFTPAKSGRSTPVRDLSIGILEVLANQGIKALFNYKEIMSMLSFNNCFHTGGSVTGTLTLMTRQGILIREKTKSKGNRPMWHYKLNEDPDNLKHILEKYNIERSIQ